MLMPPGCTLSKAQVEQLMKARNRVGRILEYHSAVAGLKAGPASLQGLSQWPEHMVKDIMRMPGSNRSLKRMLALLERGLVFHSDCSGKCTPEQTLMLLEDGLRLNGA